MLIVILRYLHLARFSLSNKNIHENILKNNNNITVHDSEVEFVLLVLFLLSGFSLVSLTLDYSSLQTKES